MGAEDLMQRLAVSKKIMDKHNEIKRGDVRTTTPMVEDYQPVNASYNLPQELISETQNQKPIHNPSQGWNQRADRHKKKAWKGSNSIKASREKREPKKASGEASIQKHYSWGHWKSRSPRRIPSACI